MSAISAGQMERATMEAVGFGGGCHWCTEGVFQILCGVAEVDQGFLQSTAPDDAWAEGVIVRFDPAIVPLDILIEIHLRTHSANSGYSPNGRYRSAVYVEGDDQRQWAEAAITRLRSNVDTAARTKVLPLVGFRPSDERYRNYYRTDPNRPFCRRYIDPKLAAIRRDFAAHALRDA